MVIDVEKRACEASLTKPIGGGHRRSERSFAAQVER